MMKSRIILILEVLGLVVISAAADDLDLGTVRVAPVRKRNQLRHRSSRNAHATEIQGDEGERFDPFMGIKRDLRFDSSLSSLSHGLSFSNPTYMAPLSLSFSMANTNEEGLLLSDGYMLQHKLTEADGTITMELTYEGDAWIGIAFSEDDRMGGSDGVIGSSDLGIPQKYRLGQGVIELMSPEEQTLTNATVEFRNGQTYMKFTKPLVEPNQISVTAGVNNMLWAYGSSRTIGYHAARSSFTLDLAASESLDDQNEISIFVPVG